MVKHPLSMLKQQSAISKGQWKDIIVRSISPSYFIVKKVMTIQQQLAFTEGQQALNHMVSMLIQTACQKKLSITSTVSQQKSMPTSLQCMTVPLVRNTHKTEKVDASRYNSIFILLSSSMIKLQIYTTQLYVQDLKFRIYDQQERYKL